MSLCKTLHVLLQFDTLAFDHLMLRLTLRGLHRNNPHVPHQAPPVTPEILTQIHSLLDFNKEEDVVFWAVVLVGFFLLLRKCNLVPDAACKFDGAKQLRIQEVEFCGDHAWVALTWMKNHQFSKEPLVFSLPLIEGSVLCPVSAILAMLSLVHRAPHKSLFKLSNGMCFSYYMLQ